MANVGQVEKIRFTPLKRREGIERRASYGDEVKRSHELMRGDLAVSGAVRTVAQCVKRISAVSWI
jgi:hypothetical protein